MPETEPNETEARQARGAAAVQAAMLLAIDPIGLGGAVLKGAHEGREPWLAMFRAALPIETPLRRMPISVSESRLFGGLDLAATLVSGRPVAELGLLGEADQGVLLVPLAERLSQNIAASLGLALDRGTLRVERDGLAHDVMARFALLLFDEGRDEEGAPSALRERLAFEISLDALTMPDAPPAELAAVLQARARLPTIRAPEDALHALVATAAALGIDSMRAPMLALRAAKAAAALADRGMVEQEDLELAARLVLAPRATRLPETEPEPAPEPEPEETPPEPSDANEPDQPTEAQPLADSVVDAARAAIPSDLLALLTARALDRRGKTGGRSDARRISLRRGRPAGVRQGQPHPGVRLALVETLRAAAPWQKIRARPPGGAGRIALRRADFRIARYKEATETVTIFVVDASGSAALHRLAEVKGAVELVLADCYVRRDEVALITFRGAQAELALPPTRSLVRAKRALSGLPGGGGTPLASAVETATHLALGLRKKGQTPVVVLLTDGKANVARDGRPGRPQAEADVKAAARAFRLAGLAGLILDIAPRPGEPARRLAADMGLRYIPLPYADAEILSKTVLAAVP
jgi:magnesium chelatase subunit D